MTIEIGDADDDDNRNCVDDDSSDDDSDDDKYTSLFLIYFNLFYF